MVLVVLLDFHLVYGVAGNPFNLPLKFSEHVVVGGKPVLDFKLDQLLRRPINSASEMKSLMATVYLRTLGLDSLAVLSLPFFFASLLALPLSLPAAF